MQSEDTAIIKVAKARFEERKHCCPKCGSVVAVELGPNDETERALPILEDALRPTD